MTEKNHNNTEPDWNTLLEILQSEPTNLTSLKEEQREQLEELRTLMAQTFEALDIYAQLDVDKGWQKLRTAAQQRHLIRADSISVLATKRLWSWIAVVASLVMAFTIGGYYIYQKSQSTEQALLVEKTDIQPGSNRATLVLSDGKTFVLRSDQEGIAVDKEGIQYLDGSVMPDIAEVSYATLHVPRAGQYQLILSDGTKVWLNAETKLTYPTVFESNERVVTLEGEAYFEVKHDSEKPFLVACEGQVVKVLGTSFNIQAYADQPRSLTTLVEGSVQLSNKNGATRILKPDEQASISAHQLDVKKVNTQRYTAWKDGVIVLDKQDIKSIIPQLERWYDVEFNQSGIPSKTSTLSGEIPRDIPLSTLLEVLGEQLKLQFEIKGRRVMVKN